MYKSMFLILSTLFIVALSWHVSFPSNFLVFGFIILLVTFYSINPFPIHKKTTYLIIASLFIYLFLLLVNITMYDRVNFELINTFIKKIGLSIFIFIFILLFYHRRENILFRSIDYALSIIVGLWLMQLVMYYITGDYIDLLQPVAGEDRPQRYQAYFIESALSLDLIRPTSIYIEPGTYAVNTLPLLILSYLHHDRITKLHTLVLITYFASLSLFGIIIAAAFIIVVQLHKFKFKLDKRNILFLLLSIIIIVGIQEYLYFRFIEQGNIDAVGMRENALAYWLALDEKSLIFGSGNGNMIFSKSAIVDDTSFIFKLVFEYGIFSIPLFAFIFFISWGVPILFLFIILVTKLHYLIYIVWFYLAALHLHKQKKQFSLKSKGDIDNV